MLLPLYKSLQEHEDYIKTANDREKMKYDRGGEKSINKREKERKIKKKYG